MLLVPSLINRLTHVHFIFVWKSWFYLFFFKYLLTPHSWIKSVPYLLPLLITSETPPSILFVIVCIQEIYVIFSIFFSCSPLFSLLHIKSTPKSFLYRCSYSKTSDPVYLDFDTVHAFMSMIFHTTLCHLFFLWTI